MTRMEVVTTEDVTAYSAPVKMMTQKELLLSSDSSDVELSEGESVPMLLELHERQQEWRTEYRRDPLLKRYKYFSAGLLMETDPWLNISKEHPKRRHPNRRALMAARRARILKMKRKMKEDQEWQPNKDERKRPAQQALAEDVPDTKKKPQSTVQQRRKLWTFIAKKEIPKMAKQFAQARHTVSTNCRKVSLMCQREWRKMAAKSQKISRDAPSRAKKLLKEVLIYWKRYEKMEKEHRKKAEKEALEQKKHDDELRDAKRQQRKLNFLITQTELYAHFMARKLTGGQDSSDQILQQLEDTPLQREIQPGVVVNLEDPSDYDSEAVKAKVLANVQSAFSNQETSQQSFMTIDGPDLQETFDKQYSLANPTLPTDKFQQPSIFQGQLKIYQLKGMNWLSNLYNQGINGILADEMGLGKTVQSIALLAHLAETQNIWGPFLVVAPASTLHNWQQECSRFVPYFNVLPYWGGPQDRKTIRKFWSQKGLYRRDSPLHMLITSYQLIVRDIKYFQRTKWQYMILDEAQAIKSSTSQRWKILLSFNCRNRLLLTGTPIQNNMAELWALLHFVMPTLFDSHAEFNEWFSKDIEGRSDKKTGISESQLSRLHMILKPFMLRRCKVDVENEMAKKIVIQLMCELAPFQRKLYQGLRQRISLEDLLRSSSNLSHAPTSHLMNLVMQFRKVCNHPDLFERREVKSPVIITASPPITLPKLIFHQGFLANDITTRSINRLATITMGINTADYIHRSLSNGDNCYSALRLMDTTPMEYAHVMLSSDAHRLEVVMTMMLRMMMLYHLRLWGSHAKRLARSELVLWPDLVMSPASIRDSPLLQGLVISGHTHHTYTHCTHRLYPMRTTPTYDSCEDEPREGDHLVCNGLEYCSSSNDQVSTLYTERHFVPTELPRCLVMYIPKTQATPSYYYCSDTGAMGLHGEIIRGGSPNFVNVVMRGCVQQQQVNQVFELYPCQPQGLSAIYPYHGWSNLRIPDKEVMISDSSKMVVLDRLLAKLKAGGHRVLIYSQMTRMIDILEEYMQYRHHRYIRLDGSSRISERRDMVDDFQTKSDIFVFLLSTRAGGLGINLTAADTVIFYDSDWNPTVDQQAMDRAHRLGQTKQVTVYRLVVKGTVEERILQRAEEKSEIQKMVITGGEFRSDALKPKEVVSLLLDDEEMEARFMARQSERHNQEDKQKKGRGSKRKQDWNNDEPLAKRYSLDTPSPLQVSRPNSVTSSFVNDTNNIDVVNDDSDSNSGLLVIADQGSGRNTPDTSRAVTPKLTPAGSKGKVTTAKSRPKKKGGSAAAAAGAMAGKLAASQAAFAAYGVPYNPLLSSTGLLAVPSPVASSNPPSNHSSPRASPVPPYSAVNHTP
ncbi:chromatin-remodeling ATPase INO80-like isoform X2 [Dysidea avara]|uniref:chromatin-remodeling ATPase INO80-like isoform X2 n=1 Tax=Dysidea avara TaxID=196820 RepID=UPI00332C64B9